MNDKFLEKYKAYLKKRPEDLFGEPFWLPLPFEFPPPAPERERRSFFTKTQNSDLLVVGAVTKIINPYEQDTPTRNVPELEIEMKDAQGNLFVRDTAPLYAVASHIFAPELWHEFFIIPRNTSLEIALTIKRSPTVSGGPPQGITGEIVFKCIRFQRISI
ncbi:MAG: hypothetical protein RML33_11165 [Acidobacteriota bacterium]|nr:hypothetical protein [Leptospiraceae bacterium]MDW8305380.1 hypothetical protein [Acidobacteriota bacterium]